MNDPIALWYNDKIVLESHHVATSFLTMKVVACIFQFKFLLDQTLHVNWFEFVVVS